MKKINININISIFFFILLSSLLLIFCQKDDDNTQTTNDETTNTASDNSSTTEGDSNDNSSDDENSEDVKFTEADTIQLSEISTNLDEVLSNENYLNNVLSLDELANVGVSFRLSQTTDDDESTDHERNTIHDIILQGKDTAIRTEIGDSIIFRRDSIIILTYTSPTSTEWVSRHIRTRTTLDRENRMFPKTRSDEYRDFNPGTHDEGYLGQMINGKIHTIIYNPRPSTPSEPPQRSYTKISNFKTDTITISGTMRDFDSLISADSENGFSQLKRTDDTMEYSFASGRVFNKINRKSGILIYKPSTEGYPMLDQITINGMSTGSDSKGNKWITDHKNLVRKITCARGQVPVSGERVTQFTLANGKSFESKIIYAGSCADTCTQVVTDDQGNSYTKTIQIRYKQFQ